MKGHRGKEVINNGIKQPYEGLTGIHTHTHSVARSSPVNSTDLKMKHKLNIARPA